MSVLVAPQVKRYSSMHMLTVTSTGANDFVVACVMGRQSKARQRHRSADGLIHFFAMPGESDDGLVAC